MDNKSTTAAVTTWYISFCQHHAPHKNIQVGNLHVKSQNVLFKVLTNQQVNIIQYSPNHFAYKNNPYKSCFHIRKDPSRDYHATSNESTEKRTMPSKTEFTITHKCISQTEERANM